MDDLRGCVHCLSQFTTHFKKDAKWRLPICPQPAVLQLMRQRSTGLEILSIRVVALCFGHVIDLRNSAFLAVAYVMFEAALVDYVVPDPCQQTTHSHDTALMRFCAFT